MILKKIFIVLVLFSMFSNAQNKLELPKDVKYKISNSGKYITILGKKEKTLTIRRANDFNEISELKFKKEIKYKLTSSDQLIVLEENKKLTIYDLPSVEKKSEYFFKKPVSFLYVSESADLIYLVPKKIHEPFSFSFSRELLGMKINDSAFSIYNKYVFNDEFKSKKTTCFYLIENYVTIKEFDSLAGVRNVVDKLELIGYVSKFFKDNSMYIMAYSLSQSDRLDFGTYSSVDESDEIRKYYLLKIDLKSNATSYKMLDFPSQYNKELLIGSPSSIYDYSAKKFTKESRPFYYYSYDENSFSVISRNYAGYIHDEYPKIQNTKIFELNYDLSILNIVNITQEGADNKFEYVDVNSTGNDFGSYYKKERYRASGSYNNFYTKWIPNENSLGHFYKIDDDIYYCSVLKGIENDYGVKVIISKYSEGLKIWSKNLILADKKYDFDIGGYNTNISLMDKGGDILFKLSNTDKFYMQLSLLNKVTGDLKKTFRFGELHTRKDKEEYGDLINKGIVFEILDLKGNKEMLNYIKTSSKGNSYDVLDRNGNLFLIERTKKGRKTIIKI